MSTNWQTLGSVIIATAVIVGGLFSVKSDIAAATAKASTAADDASKALDVARDIRDEVTRIRWHLGLESTVSKPGANPITRHQP